MLPSPSSREFLRLRRMIMNSVPSVCSVVNSFLFTRNFIRLSRTSATHPLSLAGLAPTSWRHRKARWIGGEPRGPGEIA